MNKTQADISAELGLDNMLAKYGNLVPTDELVRNAIYDVAGLCFAGIRETGHNAGYWPTVFLKAVGLPPGHPWCMAFVQYVYWFVSVEVFGSSDLLPHNSAGTQSVYAWADKRGCTVLNPDYVLAGDCVIWRDGRSGKGHAGIVLGKTVDDGAYTFQTVEGNTNEAGSREGDGVYRRSWSANRWGRWGVPVDGKRTIRGVISVGKLIELAWGK